MSDQGYTDMRDGCFKCGGNPRPRLVPRGQWIVCEKCGGGYGEATPENIAHLAAAPRATRHEPNTWQGGLSNDELRAALESKLRRGTTYSDQDLKPFALGIEWANSASKCELARITAERDELRADAERYRWLADHARSTSEHWGGRWSLVIDGPAPTRHDCVAALDAAVDAARAALNPKKPSCS